MHEATTPGDADAVAARPSFQRFGRRAAETFVGLIAYSAANSLFYLLVARTLGPHGTGVVSVATMLATVLALLVFGLLDRASVYLGTRDPGARGALLANALLLATVGGTLLAVAAFVVLRALGVTFGASPRELAIVLASVPFGAGHRLILSLVLASGRSLAFNVVSALAPTILLVAAAAYFAVAGAGVTAAVVLFALTQAVVFGIAVATSGIRVARPSRELLLESLRYGFRAYVGSVVQLANYRLDLFLVSALRGAPAAGIYGVAVVLAELLTRIAWAASVILFPRVAADDAAPVDFTARVARTVVAVSLAAAVLVLAAGALVVLPLLGGGFDDALAPLALLLPGVIAVGVMNVLSSDFAGRGSPGVTSTAAFVGLAATVVLSPLLISLYGPSGAAAASTVSYVASAAFVGLLFARRFGVSAGELLVVRRGDMGLGRFRRPR